MKKIITFGTLLLLAIMVTAWEHGDSITQQQVDNIDADTVNLQCQDEGHTISIRTGLTYKYSCFSIFERDSDFAIYRKQLKKRFDIKYLFSCVGKYGLQDCKSNIKDRLTDHLKNNKKQIRQDIKNMQTNSLVGYNWSVDYV